MENLCLWKKPLQFERKDGQIAQHSRPIDIQGQRFVKEIGRLSLDHKQFVQKLSITRLNQSNNVGMNLLLAQPSAHLSFVPAYLVYVRLLPFDPILMPNFELIRLGDTLNLFGHVLVRLSFNRFIRLMHWFQLSLIFDLFYGFFLEFLLIII